MLNFKQVFFVKLHYSETTNGHLMSVEAHELQQINSAHGYSTVNYGTET